MGGQEAELQVGLSHESEGGEGEEVWDSAGGEG